MGVFKMLKRVSVSPPGWRPKMSIVVVVYKMPRQAKNTLTTLSSEYQRNVSHRDYEVIVVENKSREELGKKAATSFGPNFRYIYRENPGVSPVPSINHAVAQAKGSLICVMIDGARMVTPGAIRQTLNASRISELAVVAVPGYHLGQKVQQEAEKDGYNESFEKKLLDSISWKTNGYRLFEISCFSSTSKRGYFLSGGESNCITVTRKFWDRLGGYDDRFISRGGGLSNLDFYKRACEYPGAELINIAGEGSFHQYHGGVTTSGAGDAREKVLQKHFAEYRNLRGNEFSPPKVDATVYSIFTAESLVFAVPSVDTYWKIKKYKPEV